MVVPIYNIYIYTYIYIIYTYLLNTMRLLKKKEMARVLLDKCQEIEE